MPSIKIKEMGNAVATSGVHLGGGPERRKLEPGEVLFLSEDDPLFNLLWRTGRLELTLEAPNRPLDYADKNQARLCSPTFKPASDDEAEAMLDAHEEVMELMAAEAGPIQHNVPDEPEEPAVMGAGTADPEPEVDIAALQRKIARDQTMLDGALGAKADAAAPAASRREQRRQRIAESRGEPVEKVS